MPVIRRKIAPTPTVSTSTPPTVEQRLLRIPQVAYYLNRSIWRIRQMISTGELRTVGRTKPFVIDRHDLDAYIERAKTA